MSFSGTVATVHSQVNTFPQVSRALISDLDQAGSVNVSITCLCPANRCLRGHASRGCERQTCNDNEGQPSHHQNSPEGKSIGGNF